MVLRTWVADLTTSLPSMVIFPLVGVKRVVIMEMVVDFPAPLGPKKPKISPSLTSKLTPFTARISLSKTFTRSLTSIILSIALPSFSQNTLHILVRDYIYFIYTQYYPYRLF